PRLKCAGDSRAARASAPTSSGSKYRASIRSFARRRCRAGGTGVIGPEPPRRRPCAGAVPSGTGLQLEGAPRPELGGVPLGILGAGRELEQRRLPFEASAVPPIDEFDGDVRIAPVE